MSREMSNYNFSVENIEELAFAQATTICVGSVQIEGEDLSDVVTVEFAHAGGPTIVNAPFRENTGTSMDIFAPDLIGETITGATVIDSDGNETTVEWTGPGVTPLINLVSADSTAADRIELAGTGFLPVTQVALTFTTLGEVVVNFPSFVSQNATSIVLTDPAWGGDTLEEVEVRDQCEQFLPGEGGTDSLTGLSLLVDS